jgi:hypothetical protein
MAAFTPTSTDMHASNGAVPHTNPSTTPLQVIPELSKATKLSLQLSIPMSIMAHSAGSNFPSHVKSLYVVVVRVVAVRVVSVVVVVVIVLVIVVVEVTVVAVSVVVAIVVAATVVAGEGADGVMLLLSHLSHSTGQRSETEMVGIEVAASHGSVSTAHIAGSTRPSHLMVVVVVAVAVEVDVLLVVVVVLHTSICRLIMSPTYCDVTFAKSAYVLTSRTVSASPVIASSVAAFISPSPPTPIA